MDVMKFEFVRELDPTMTIVEKELGRAFIPNQRVDWYANEDEDEDDNMYYSPANLRIIYDKATDGFYLSSIKSEELYFKNGKTICTTGQLWFRNEIFLLRQKAPLSDSVLRVDSMNIQQYNDPIDHVRKITQFDAQWEFLEDPDKYLGTDTSLDNINMTFRTCWTPYYGVIPIIKIHAESMFEGVTPTEIEQDIKFNNADMKFLFNKMNEFSIKTTGTTLWERWERYEAEGDTV